jgi:hypothetical protein
MLPLNTSAAATDGGVGVAEVDWINVALAALWTTAGVEGGQAAGGIGAVAREAAAEALAAALETSSAKPGSVASVTVRRLDLGRAPPALHSLRCIQHHGRFRNAANETKRDNRQDGQGALGPFLVFEADVGWEPPGFELVVEVSSTRLARSALPRLAVRAADLRLRLAVHVAVELLPAPPFVGRVGFTLAAPPTLDLSLSPHFTGAARPSNSADAAALSSERPRRLNVDVARLPVLRDWLHTVVTKSFAPYVDPRVAAFDLGASLTTPANATATADGQPLQPRDDPSPSAESK